MATLVSCLICLAIHTTFLSSEVLGARVLVILPLTYSAITPFIPAVEELYTKYGHQSTIVTNKEIAKGYENKTYTYIISDHLNEVNFDDAVEKIIESSTKGNKIATLRQILGHFSSLCNAYFTDTALTEKLKRGSFDVAVVWKGVLGMCTTLIPYKLSIPFIMYSNGHDPITDRIPFSPSFVPHQMLPFGDKMSFTERLVNTIACLGQLIVGDAVTPSDAFAKYIPEKPYISTSELVRKAELHLIDSDPLLDFSRPVFSNHIFVGGMALQPAKELTGDLKSFMNSAKNGAVLVSFGSLLKGFPTKVIDILVNAFTKMKDIKFVFRHGKKVIQKENIYFMPWIPQKDLLGHPNAKVFITHCGNSGQFEALYHGVPMLGIPVNGDQFNNAKRMESKGYGITLPITDISSEDIVQSLRNLLTNENIQRSIKLLRKYSRQDLYHRKKKLHIG